MSTRIRARTLWLAAFAAMGIAQVAFASDQASVTLAELVAKNPRILIATCTAADSRHVSRYGDAIFTFYKFDRVETLKGPHTTALELRLIGGEIDGVSDSLDDLPPRIFAPGRRYVIFLGANNADGYPVIPFEGLFRVTDATEGPVPHAVPLIEGSEKAQPLDPFLKRLRALIAGKAGATH